MSEPLSLRIDLRDRQLVDADDVPVGRVEDLVIELPPGGGRPRVTQLLTGSQALGERLGGTVGGWIARASARLRGPEGAPGPTALDVAEIAEISHQIDLRRPLAEMQEVAGLEHWLAERVVSRIPGAGDARE